MNNEDQSMKCPLKGACVAPDKPTKCANLNFRFVYTLIAWLVLGLGIAPGISFFSSMILFSLPLLMDYCKFRPDNGWRLYLRNFAFSSCLFWVILGICGLVGILSVKDMNHLLLIRVSDNYIILKGLVFPLKYVWLGMGINMIITSVDAVAYESPFEKMVLKELNSKAS